MSPTKTAKKSVKRATATGKKSQMWTAEEKAAMRERAKEMKAAASKEEGEKAALAAIAAMSEPDRSLARGVHAIIQANAPSLAPKTWYGMPAYADHEGNVICFFQPGQKFKTRYSTLGFNNLARLDEGSMWPVAFALTELTPAEEARIGALVKKAVGGA